MGDQDDVTFYGDSESADWIPASWRDEFTAAGNAVADSGGSVLASIGAATATLPASISDSVDATETEVKDAAATQLGLGGVPLWGYLIGIIVALFLVAYIEREALG